MKLFNRSIFTVLALGLLLFGCRPDNVDPSANGGGRNVAGAFDSNHPALDTVCKYADTVFFRSADGSFEVNKCVGAGGTAIPCTTPQQKWGHFMMYNGYVYETGGPVHYLDVDFTMAPGWVCDLNNWLFTTASSITLDPNTNLPTVGTDWSSEAINPSRNEWKVAIPIDQLPPNCFDMACRMSVLRLRVNGQPNENFRTTVWAINRNWNNPNSEYASNNEYAIHYCPLACLENQCPTTEVSDVCEVVYTGLTCTNTLGTTTLTADSAGTNGNATYAWSNGATTQSITVSPTATAAYTVTVTNGSCDIRVVTFNVNVINVACTIAGNGGNGGNNNGSGSGSGSGSGNHQANGHNHGCNNSHSGGNSNCNRRGHGRNCSGSHPSNRACTGGHTRGCDGNHSSNTTCQSRSGHRYNCNGNHNGNTCNSSLQHAQGCTQNHSAYRACSSGNGHSGCNNGNGGSGSGSGSGHGGNGGNNGGGTTAGVTICHVPPGNPAGATTICVSYAQLATHLTSVCGTTTGGNGGNGNGGSGSGSGHGSGHGGHGSGHGGNGGSGSGSGNGSGGHCSHSGGQHGCGNGNGAGHSGDYIGACGQDPCSVIIIN